MSVLYLIVTVHHKIQTSVMGINYASAVMRIRPVKACQTEIISSSSIIVGVPTAVV